MADNDIKYECLLKWQASEEEIGCFKANFEKWCEFATDEEKEICLKLLQKYDTNCKANNQRREIEC